MKTLNNNTQLFTGLNLDTLCKAEHEIDAIKTRQYGKLGEIIESDNYSEKDEAFVCRSESRKYRRFRKLEKLLKYAIELASINEENGHFA
ncbi:hypothetical protein [Bacillus sp. Au-Bac7]|uniref:hypothetical protein n=1 Tax=Bacillus sp. Au-Bac7 TaxID=2906458 RepID=UPI001E3CA788|nr:hypothetical protein [Bacillus sp. Au-Bac7]MCE4051855.1 hypothetical protein [Bacillus sp. Au-Bac7]